MIDLCGCLKPNFVHTRESKSEEPRIKEVEKVDGLRPEEFLCQLQLPVVQRHHPWQRDKSLPFTSPVPAAVPPRVQLLGGSVELAARPPDPQLHTQP